MLHQTLRIQGRAWFMGDLHGCFGQLREQLFEVGFNPGRGDVLIGVGDLIDRGPDNLACLNLLQHSWFHTVLGNHEDIMLDALQSDAPDAKLLWQRNGGGWFYRLAADERQQVRDLLPKMATLPLVLTVETPAGRIGVVHADPATHDWRELDDTFCQQHRRTLLWERNRIMELLLGGRCNSVISGIDRVVLGHTPMRGDWLQQGNLCWLDTGATYHGHLTLLCDEELLASQPFT